MLKEDFLHYLWKVQGFDTSRLVSEYNEKLIILKIGDHNHHSGPDFYNAKIQIGDQLWVGTVEMHVKSSDWYVHTHEIDPNYDNVILHVVWENDMQIYRRDQSMIPTLVLKHFVNDSLLSNYRKLFALRPKWINCEDRIAEVDTFKIESWFERLFVERLADRARQVDRVLIRTNNDWEATLFKLMVANFGLKVNKEAFTVLATQIDYAILRKVQLDPLQLEAFLFGQATMLTQDIQDSYYTNLQVTYEFLRSKYKLQNQLQIPFQFFRLRPSNFPTIRIAQLSALFANEHQLFSKIMEAKTIQNIYTLFDVQISSYWNSHYSFTSLSKLRAKRITNNFIDLLIINTILPLKYFYLKSIDKFDPTPFFELLRQLKPEKNSVIKKFNSLGVSTQDALESQAVLQLKNEYCTPNLCLSCPIGSFLIKTENRG